MALMKLLSARSPETSKMAAAKNVIWTKKDLLGMEYLTKEEIELILDNAKSFKEVLARPLRKVPTISTAPG